MLGEEFTDDQIEGHLRWFYLYFDLTNAQIFLRVKGRVRRETWTEWCDGIRDNFRQPAFKAAWNRVRSKLVENSTLNELRRLEATGFMGDPRSWSATDPVRIKGEDQSQVARREPAPGTDPESNRSTSVSKGAATMPRFTARGTLERYGKAQWNVLVRNSEEMSQFWSKHRIDTKLDWAGMSPPKATVSRKELVARCDAAGEGAEVEYDLEVQDRANGRGVTGVDLRVAPPVTAGDGG